MGHLAEKKKLFNWLVILLLCKNDVEMGIFSRRVRYNVNF